MILLALGFITAYVLAASFIIMWAWNVVMTSIFGLPIIDAWQAFGVFILCQFLFPRSTTKS